jgi:hypothetical protein
MPVREKVEQIIKFTTLGDIYRAVDILGGTEEELDNFRKSTTDFLMGFSQLSPSHPVMIVVDQKDKGCEGCGIGEHCMRQREIDETYINGFREIAEKVGVMENVKVFQNSTISDTRPRNVDSILTTFQTVRAVIVSDEFKKFMYTHRF